MSLRILRSERGTTLVELLLVVAILGVVLAAVATVFVSGSASELDSNRRVQAQQQARLALDRFRTDVHCASAAEAQTIGTYPGVKLAVGDCTQFAATPTVSWCVVPVTSSPPRYQLYRSTATSGICAPGDSTRVLVADYLTGDAVFTTATIPENALQTVGVDIRVSVDPAGTHDLYELQDAVVARNSTRCATSGGCAAPTVS